MKVLLHTCCGPCACACVPRLKAEGHEAALFFANSNIDTAEEFEKRLLEHDFGRVPSRCRPGLRSLQRARLHRRQRGPVEGAQ